MAAHKYVQDEGEWFLLSLEDGVRQMCCSCSLVHDIEFRKTRKGIEMRFLRNERATAAARRKHRHRMRIVIDE